MTKIENIGNINIEFIKYKIHKGIIDCIEYIEIFQTRKTAINKSRNINVDNMNPFNV